MSATRATPTCIVRDLPDLLRRGDILVANDTRVIPAQLTARRGAARIGITLDRPRQTAPGTRSPATPAGCTSATCWHSTAATRSCAQVRIATRMAASHWRFNLDGAAFREGLAPMPARWRCRPTSRGRPGRSEADAADYQTIFARSEGAVAAPTAGLHFTPGLLDCAASGAACGAPRVTLHVGAGTFLPVRR